MTNYVRVRNIQNRTFNGIKQGQCVDTPNPDFYLANGFWLVNEDWSNKISVTTETETMSKEEAKALLDKAWIKYDKKAKLDDLIELIKFNNVSVTTETETIEDDLSNLEDELNG